MLDMHTSEPIVSQPLETITLAQLVAAKRALAIAQRLDRLPVMGIDEREILDRVRRNAILFLGVAAEHLVDALDLADGDPEAEDATGAEDEIFEHKYEGPGCPIADCGEDEGDREGIDEREPDEGA